MRLHWALVEGEWECRDRCKPVSMGVEMGVVSLSLN
jgi:hypothetical protein